MIATARMMNEWQVHYNKTIFALIILTIVLEFELRKAQETIKSLRGSLTKATGEQVLL